MRLATTLFLFLCVSCSLFKPGSAKPQFLKEGFGATYTFETIVVITQMISNPDDPQDLGADGALGQPNKKSTYEWQVTSLDGSDAIVDVHLDLPVEELNRTGKGWIPTVWNKTAKITMNVDNREATALNGTSLGTISYWIDPSVEKGDNVSMYGKPPYQISETVRNYLYNPVRTPAGEFDCWVIRIPTRSDLGFDLGIKSIWWYDKATGILVAVVGSYFDVVTMLMGIQQIDIASDDYEMPTMFVLTSFGISGTSARSPDVNGDGTVNIVDISQVAAAFGYSTGDLLYRPECDLNSDGLVNILDLSTVAKKFGEKITGTASTLSFNLSSYLPHIFAATAAATIPAAIYVAKRTKRKHT